VIGIPARAATKIKSSTGESLMSKKVEFDAHKVVKKPTEVEFTTKNGERVDFVAKKPTKVPVHVKFTKKGR
jgi:hypothetical protein